MAGRGRVTEPQRLAEIPAISRRGADPADDPFAVIRAAALAIAVAISFGLKLPVAYWMPIATIIAMKPPAASDLFAEQRIAGTVVGAAVAALVLLAVDNRTALEVIVVVLVALAASIHGVNYAWYTAALGGAILIAADVPHPSTWPTRDAGSCSRSPAWGSPSSSCSWRTGCKSTPPKRHHRHLLTRPRRLSGQDGVAGARHGYARQRLATRISTPASGRRPEPAGFFPRRDVRPYRWLEHPGKLPAASNGHDRTTRPGPAGHGGGERSHDE